MAIPNLISMLILAFDDGLEAEYFFFDDRREDEHGDEVRDCLLYTSDHGDDLVADFSECIEEADQCLGSLAADGNDAGSDEAVSYTHLDVYKRQEPEGAVFFVKVVFILQYL